MIRVWTPDAPLDVYEGLAIEDALLDRPEAGDPLLMIWQGPAAVVMGKNQNPWREVNLAELEHGNLPLARRVSGGGTVYHDPGNLNLSWVVPREAYRASDITDVLLQAIDRMGLVGEVSETGATRVQGKKVSGSAFCYRRDQVLHHGTLLLSAELDRMRRVLSPPRVLMDTHAVRSIPASVANLTDLVPGLTQDAVVDTLISCAAGTFGEVARCGHPLPDIGNTGRISEMSSREWLWDHTPAFTVRITGPEGSLVAFEVRKGMLGKWTRNGESLEGLPPVRFQRGELEGIADHPELQGFPLLDGLETAGWYLPRI